MTDRGQRQVRNSGSIRTRTALAFSTVRRPLRIPPQRSVPLVALLCATAGIGQDRRPPVWTGQVESRRVGDTDEIVLTGGLRLVDEMLDLDVRPDRAVVTLDRAAVGRVLRGLDSGSGLPRREPVRPPDRRRITEEVLRRRIGDFLAAIRGEGRALTDAPVDLGTFRSLHLEGDVAIVRSGIEVLRASQLTWSLTDDRMVLRDLVLRLVDARDGLAAPLVTVRAPELVRQDGRFVGRGVSVTTSPRLPLARSSLSMPTGSSPAPMPRPPSSRCMMM